MSLKFNLYDFFSYTIPGFLFLIEILYFIEYVCGMKLNFNQLFYTINIVQFFVMLIFSIIISHLISQIADLAYSLPKSIKNKFNTLKKWKKITDNSDNKKSNEIKHDSPFHKLKYNYKKYLSVFCLIIQKKP